MKGMAVGKGANRPKDALVNRAKLPHGCWAQAADERSVGGETKNGLRLRQKCCEQCGGRDKRLNAAKWPHTGHCPGFTIRWGRQHDLLATLRSAAHARERYAGKCSARGAVRRNGVARKIGSSRACLRYGAM
jgi:hypothetical protein